MFSPEPKPLIVQSDGSILLDVHDPGASEARRMLAAIAELEKSPEHVHTYRLSNLSLWNAASAGITWEQAVDELNRYSRFPLPKNLCTTIQRTMEAYGSISLYETDQEFYLYLLPANHQIFMELKSNKKLQELILPLDIADSIDLSVPALTSQQPFNLGQGFLVPLLHRGTVKQRLLELGYPTRDLAPLKEGDPIEIQLSQGQDFQLRDYQDQAVEAFLGDKKPGTGFGTVVLPCGSGKTIIGMHAIASLAQETLVLTTSTTAVHQWIRELKEKTTIDPELIGEYTGVKKEIKPITVATYQVLVWNKHEEKAFPHFQIFRSRQWGLLIYDEVHTLPAPVFRITAELQAVRRLGLTATLVREDGLEKEVFALVGPKRFDIPWKDLEARGWIAEALCVEYRVDLPEHLQIPYAIAAENEKFRIASENPRKLEVLENLLEKHLGESILIIGLYLDQLKQIAQRFNTPLLTGKTGQKEREKVFGAFREGEIKVLTVSKIANFAIDLPDASIAIQLSGTYGSRQEEAQRLGRILRPKEQQSRFYTIISKNTREVEFSANRQQFLTEQGYEYRLENWE